MGDELDIDQKLAIGSNKYPIMKFFKFSHLPDHLQQISCHFAKAAVNLYECDGKTHPSLEIAAGLRKLLEAKDCFVRAALI